MFRTGYTTIILYLDVRHIFNICICMHISMQGKYDERNFYLISKIKP